MPQARTTTDTAGRSRNRFVVSLPDELGGKIDRLGVKMREQVEATLGVAPDLSRAQIVQSLVESHLRRIEREAENGAGQS